MTPDELAAEALRRGGTVTQGDVRHLLPALGEAQASCRLDGETQIVPTPDEDGCCIVCGLEWEDPRLHSVHECPPGFQRPPTPTKPKRRPPKVERKARALKQSALAVQLFQSICQREGLPVPQPEVQFCAGRKWRVDWMFEWEPIGPRLALEIEGGAWTEGRHTRGSGFVADIAKYNRLSIEGIHLLRVTPKEFASGAAVMLVREWVAKRELV